MINNSLLGNGLAHKLTELSTHLTELKSKLSILKKRLNNLAQKLAPQPVNCNQPDQKGMESLGSFWSFLGKKDRLGEYIFKRPVDYPDFAIYGEPGYASLGTRALIEMSEYAFKQSPQELINAVGARLGCSKTATADDVLAHIKASNIHPYFFSKVCLADGKKTVNMLYHPLLAKNLGPKFYDPSITFCEDVFMGIFKADGLEHEDVPFGSLAAIQVYFHDKHFSPNNARFSIADDRKVSTFWTVGIPKENPQFLAITFSLLINDSDLNKTLFLKNDNFSKETSFFTWLGFFENEAKKLDTPDRECLNDFVAFMKSLCQ